MLSLYQRQSRNRVVDPRNCPFPLRRQHLADALGLTGAHVNRTINRLKSDGVVSINGRQLAIHDLPRLSELAGFAA
jgi:CRP-like cAMP-binding protein